MARETVYMLQTFEMAGPRTFRFDRPLLCKDMPDALAVAETHARKAGRMITEVTGDPMQMEFDDPQIVFAEGAIPVGLTAPKQVVLGEAEAERQRRAWLAQHQPLPPQADEVAQPVVERPRAIGVPFRPALA